MRGRAEVGCSRGRERDGAVSLCLSLTRAGTGPRVDVPPHDLTNGSYLSQPVSACSVRGTRPLRHWTLSVAGSCELPPHSISKHDSPLNTRPSAALFANVSSRCPAQHSALLIGYMAAFPSQDVPHPVLKDAPRRTTMRRIPARTAAILGASAQRTARCLRSLATTARPPPPASSACSTWACSEARQQEGCPG